MAAEAPHAIKTHRAHRAGPVETDPDGFYVQRCLRCDRLLLFIPPTEPVEPYRVGKRIFDRALCPGHLAD